MRSIAGWLLAIACASFGLSAQAQDACAKQPPQFDEEDKPMQYCFGNVAGRPVLWLYGELGPESYDNVAKGLRQTSRYQEVWLNSPGGLVDEAFRIGLELKARRANAVVPAVAGAHCVSACTILILGAYNRTIEPGATFLIHAKSSVGQVASTKAFNRKITWGDAAAAMVKEPAALKELVKSFTDGERDSATEYVRYAMNALGGTPNEAAFASVAAQPLASPYDAGAPQPRNLSVDYALLSATGVPALQEILTQTELRSMDLMHQRMVARQAELGRGASVALRIFKANLACRIQDVCLLEQHQLESLGYHNFTPDRRPGSR